MKKGGKETKGMKRTNRLHRTSLRLCSGGGSYGVNPAPGTSAGRLFLFLKKEVPTGVISPCAFWWFHKSSSPWSKATRLPWEPWGFVCSKFLTTLFQEKSFKPGRLNKLKKLKPQREDKKNMLTATPWITFEILPKKSKIVFSSWLSKKLISYAVSPGPLWSFFWTPRSQQGSALSQPSKTMFLYEFRGYNWKRIQSFTPSWVHH